MATGGAGDGVADVAGPRGAGAAGDDATALVGRIGCSVAAAVAAVAAVVAAGLAVGGTWVVGVAGAGLCAVRSAALSGLAFCSRADDGSGPRHAHVDTDKDTDIPTATRQEIVEITAHPPSCLREDATPAKMFKWQDENRTVDIFDGGGGDSPAIHHLGR